MSLLGAIAVLASMGASGSATAINVESDSLCPSANAVREVLDHLGGRDVPRAALVTVRNRGDRLTVEFARSGDSDSETREVSVESDCELRAQAAAVVVASWLGILPGVALVVPSLAVSPVEIRYSKIVPFPPPMPSRPSVEAHASAEVPRERHGSWLGIGLQGSAGGGLVPGLRVDFSREREGGGFAFGWMASTLVTLPRSRSLDGGTSKWIRPAMGVAGIATWRSNRVQLSLDLGPLFGLTVAWGNGYPTTESDTSVTWGLTGGFRLQRLAKSSRFWLELRAIDWLRVESLQHEVLPSGPTGSAELPSVEGLLSLGWSFAI